MRTLILLFLPLLLSSQEMLTRTQALMGTFVSITLPTKHNKQISQAFQKIKTIELSLSSYDHNAHLFTLNQTHKIDYDEYLANALLASKKFYDETDGYFDITIGSISKKLYRFGEKHSTVPSRQALKKAILNIEGVYIDQTTIRTQKEITLDLGGMGKGFGVDHVASFLHDQNITKGVVALSGDIRCLDLCQFGLQSPFKKTPFALLHSKVPHLSISTSGTYRRYVQDTAHHHLINPKQATQGKSFISVSLFTKANNTKIDAYATAISVMPEQKAFAFLKQHKEIGYIVMTKAGAVHYGNLDALVSLEWLEKSENATSSNKNRNNTTKKLIENSFTHPVTTISNEIKK